MAKQEKYSLTEVAMIAKAYFNIKTAIENYERTRKEYFCGTCIESDRRRVLEMLEDYKVAVPDKVQKRLPLKEGLLKKIIVKD